MWSELGNSKLSRVVVKSRNFGSRVKTTVTTKSLTARERVCLEFLKMWLDSMHDWLAITTGEDEEWFVADPATPSWVYIAAGKLNKTIFASVNSVLGEAVISPYRVGYALGLMKWGNSSINMKVPPEVAKAARKIRLARKARREMNKMIQDFSIRVQILVRHKGRIRPGFHREIKMANSLAKKYSGREESDFHRGLADGLRGVGREAPGDRSTDATDIYLLLVIWWRFVARLSSVTALHKLVIACLGPARAGEKKRTSKICQRIGLKLSGRGRPRKNATRATPA